MVHFEAMQDVSQTHESPTVNAEAAAPTSIEGLPYIEAFAGTAPCTSARLNSFAFFQYIISYE